MNYAKSLLALPFEVQRAISTCLDHDDLRSARLACGRLNIVASQVLFASLTLRSDRISGARLVDIAESRRLAPLVRNLRVYVLCAK